MEVKLIHPDAKPPLRKRTTDAGYDIASIEDVIIPAHGMHDVHTGIIVASPPGHYLTVDGRSGMARKGVMPFRGIIDATYCGELMVALMNISDIDYKVSKYDRIAQIIAHKQIHLDFVEVEKFGPDYDQRGTAGFGSSGV
jgi:dUTP pyrophosphatase